MRAAEELDALIAFELTATEGGIDGGYTGQTPDQFVRTLTAYAEACRFTKPFIIHADHITVKNGSDEEIKAARELIRAQLTAGYSSFALDASFSPIAENISILSRIVPDLAASGVGIEVELGEVTPVNRDSNLTTVADVEEFLSGLAAMRHKTAAAGN